MKRLVFLLGVLALPLTARGDCRPYEAFAYEGRVLSCRALTAADIPSSPRHDAEGARRALAADPMVVLELELTRERRVALCEDVEACVPSARAWRATRGKRRLLAYGQPSDWESRMDQQQAFFAPLDCCDARPSPRPGCALALPLVQRTPDELVALVHEGRERPVAPAKSPREGEAETVQEASGNEQPGSSPTPAVGPEEPSRFERARALYALGPEHADEILELLRLDLEADPSNEGSRRLLAITLFGVRRFEEALTEFDAILTTAGANEVELPRIRLLKARALEALGQREQARDVLEAHWAFFQFEDDTAAQARELSTRLSLRSPSSEASDLVFLNAAVACLPAASPISLVGAVAIVVRSPDFLHLQQDGDLGPAIVSARLSGDEVFVLIARQASQDVVFFRDGKPSACSRDGGSRRGPITRSPTSTEPALRFVPAAISADDGTPLAAYEVQSADTPAPR